MTTKLTHDERWAAVKVPLERAGMKVDVLKKLGQASLLAQLEADDMIGEDQEAWNEYVNGLVEDHPQWETPLYWHRRCAESLLEQFPGSEWDGNEAPSMEEMMEAKYAVVWLGDDGNRYTVSAHADEQDVCAAIARENHSSDEPDYVEAIYDMDTDSKVGDQRDITMITTVTWKDTEYTTGDDE